MNPGLLMVPTAWGSLAGDGAPPPEEARRAAGEIVAGDAFGAAGDSLVRRAIDWLARLLAGDRTPSTVPSQSGGPAPAPERGASSVVVWLLLAVVVGALLVAVAWAARRRRRRDRPTGDEDLVSEELLDLLAGEPGLDAVGRLEAEERWREVVRVRYRSALGHVVEAGWATPVPGRTTSELRREVDTGPPELAGPFGRLTELFERVWYEGRPVGAAEASDARTLVDEVAEAARSAPERPGREVGDPGDAEHPRSAAGVGP